jgi:hypothetical protein
MHAPHPGVSKRQEAKKHSSLLGGGGGDMGVGGGFWDELRVVKKCQELEWLRHKKLAIDLSYWIVQQNLAVKGLARKPHLRLLLFRVVKLVAGVCMTLLLLKHLSLSLCRVVVVVVKFSSSSMPSMFCLQKRCQLKKILHAAAKGFRVATSFRLLLLHDDDDTTGECLQVGALPVFIVDGSAPPEKLQARIKRFNRMMHIQPVLLPLPALPQSPLPPAAESFPSSPELKNFGTGAFQQSIDECVVRIMYHLSLHCFCCC